MDPQRIIEFLKSVFGKNIPMFERFTENARRAIFFGRSEAIQRDSAFIEPDHILLALLLDHWLTNNLLYNMSLDELRAEFLPPAIKVEKSRPSGDVPLSSESKRVLRNAAEDADALLDSHIGNEHLLLGLLREKRCNAARALMRRGRKLESLRSLIRKIPRETRKANSGEQSARWRSVGIPEGYAWPSLFYNATSKTVIVELQGTESQFHRPKRLFMRHNSAEIYEPIGNPPEDISYESMVMCEQQPVIAFNSMRYSKTGAGNWVGVYVFDLIKRELSVCVTNDTFTAPAPYTGGWIAELLSMSDDAQYAYVKTGLEIRHEHSATMEYHIARMKLDNGQLELISRLKNTFL
jgi:hypothetical protein